MLAPGFGGRGTRMKVREFALAALLALLAPGFPSAAVDRAKLIEKAEMSMLVTGSIDMRPDGSVERHAIDHSEKLSNAVTQMIGAQVAQWRFEPTLVDGVPVAARTKMSLRIVARPLDEQNFDVRIQSASFSGSGGKDERMSVEKRSSLRPMIEAMVSTGMDAADLYVALKIGPDGKVMDAVVEQVNLGTIGGDVWMAKARRQLGNSALEVVRRWTFSVPTEGQLAGRSYSSGILPISVKMVDGPVPPSAIDEYGRWKAYVPGPCAPVPWRLTAVEGSNSPCASDAAPEGELTLDGSGAKLLTPLTQG
jgi:hypothetical protein